MGKKRWVRKTLAAPFRAVGNWIAAESQTPIYVSKGAPPRLRQLKTVTVSGTVLICYLV